MKQFLDTIARFIEECILVVAALICANLLFNKKHQNPNNKKSMKQFLKAIAKIPEKVFLAVAIIICVIVLIGWTYKRYAREFIG